MELFVRTQNTNLIVFLQSSLIEKKKWIMKLNISRAFLLKLFKLIVCRQRNNQSVTNWNPKKKKNLTHQLDWVTSKERNEHYTSNRRGFESKKLYQTNFLQNFSHFRGFDYLHSPPSISFCNLDNFRRLYSNTTIRSIALSLSLNRSLVVLTRFLLHLISMHFIIEFFFYLASRFVCIYLEES